LQEVSELNILFTVDVEDWFCSPDLSLADWERFPLRLEQPTHQLLDLLDECGGTATFFVLGWIAEKRPELIREIRRRGHEIASHGYSHRRVYEQTPDAFQHDIKKSKHLLEQLIGAGVHGYRAPCFSMTDWGLNLLEEEGYLYDSSLMPSLFNSAAFGSDWPTIPPALFRLTERLWELPMPVYRFGGMNIPWAGGGYFRLYPYRLFQQGASRLMRKRKDFVFYIHPYDLDNGQPRIFNSSRVNRFRRYYGLSGTHEKISKLLTRYSSSSIARYYPHLAGAAEYV
jgi:polysaccharide deacetylase family protein (PEP-CTERM system associated)